MLYAAGKHRIIGLFGGPRTLYLFGATAVAVPWLAAKQRTWVVLAASVVSGAFMVRWFIPVPLLLTWSIVRISRNAWSTRAKLLVLLGGWLALAVAGWALIPITGSSYSALNMYMGFMPAAIIWIVLDRAAGRLAGLSERDEWVYFLAFPRFVAPFVQPIGAARLLKSRQAEQTPWLSLRALGLMVYAVGVFYIIKVTHFSLKSSTDSLDLFEHGPRIFRNMLHIYAFNAAPVFLGVSVLRAVGYDLGSGFRFWAISSSPSDFFKRWNYYFFDFANVAVFMPLMSRLRRRLPVWLVYIICAYVSFALSVWVLGYVANLPGDYLAQGARKGLTNPYDIRVHLGLWTLTIAGQLLLLPLRRFQRTTWGKVFGNVYTWALAITGLTVLFVTKNTLY